MSHPHSDSQQTNRLLARAAGGDRTAFDQLFQLQRRALKKLIALRIDPRLRSRLDPSDIVQETQMVAFRRFDDFLTRRPMPFQLWLRKTAQQQLCDAQRRHLERHRRSLLREEAGLSRSSRLIARGLLSAQPSPLEKLQRLEMERRIDAAVNDLNDQDREIVIMRNVEDLTFDEIAQVLEVQAASVRQRYGRALMKLRQKLKEGSGSRT